MSAGAGQQPTHPSSQTGPNPGEKVSLYKIAYKLSLQKIGFFESENISDNGDEIFLNWMKFSG